MRWFGIISHSFNFKMICNSYCSLVVVALRNKGKPIIDTVMLCLDNRVEGASALIIENNSVCGNAPDNQRIANGNRFIATEFMVGAIVSAARNDIINTTEFEKRVGGSNSIFEIEIMCPSRSNWGGCEQKPVSIMGNIFCSIKQAHAQCRCR